MSKSFYYGTDDALLRKTLDRKALHIFTFRYNTFRFIHYKELQYKELYITIQRVIHLYKMT